ncbi:MAG: hypothetical protein JSR26_06205 [Proteobacteria bacterium]|nr:hypothetical protein [Pseudomonadota bacterium]
MGSGKTQTIALVDTTMAMHNAFYITAPAGWRVDGRVVANACDGSKAPVFHAVSADGQFEVERLPVFVSKTMGGRLAPGCDALPAGPDVTQFLQAVADKLRPGLKIVGTLPVGAGLHHAVEERMHMLSGKATAAGMQAQKVYVDAAAVRATDASGQTLGASALMSCVTPLTPSSAATQTCSAEVIVQRVPSDTPEAFAAQAPLREVKVRPDPQWLAAYRQQQNASSQK